MHTASTMKNILLVVPDDDKHKAGLFAVAVGSLVLAYYYYYSASSKKMGKHKREVSFTSLGLALGTFPEKSKCQSPIINSACLFAKGECPTVAEVAEQIVQPLLVHERFAQSLDITTSQFRPPIQPYKASDLVRELVIDGDENRTIQTVFEHLDDDLDQGRSDLPWWEILIVRNQGRGSSACVVRVHHAIADGLSLVQAFQKILRTEDGQAVKLLSNEAPRLPIRSTKKNFWSTAWSLVAATLHVVTLGASKFDDDTAFSHHNHAEMKHSGQRNFVLLPEIPLAFVKAIKSATQCTVNDVLMAAVSQAIYEYCQQQNDPILQTKGPKVQCRALLPVGFPRTQAEFADPSAALINKWSMASCEMAVGQTNVVDRLQQIRLHTTEMKEKPRAYMQLTIQNHVLKHLPRSFNRQACQDVFSRHSLVLTNVPGPPQKCRLAGKLVDKVQLFFSNILTQVDLISYGGMVYGNMIYDDAAIPNCQDFGSSYASALVDLARAYNVEVPTDVVNAALSSKTN